MVTITHHFTEYLKVFPHAFPIFGGNDFEKIVGARHYFDFDTSTVPVDSWRLGHCLGWVESLKVFNLNDNVAHDPLLLYESYLKVIDALEVFHAPPNDPDFVGYHLPIFVVDTKHVWLFHKPKWVLEGAASFCKEFFFPNEHKRKCEKGCQNSTTTLHVDHIVS